MLKPTTVSGGYSKEDAFSGLASRLFGRAIFPLFHSEKIAGIFPLHFAKEVQRLRRKKSTAENLAAGRPHCKKNAAANNYCSKGHLLFPVELLIQV